MDYGLISTIDLIVENFEFLPKTFGHCWREKSIANEKIFSRHRIVVIESCFGHHKV
jgi:hypothetical protein